MIASLGKAERERAENAITDEFNKYVENLEKDFKVATVFDVDKKLREQGTSLVSLKAEFRERLLADEYLRGAKKVIAEAPAKRPQSQAVSIDLDRRVTIDCDDRPLSEVLDKIFRDEPIINFSYDQALGTFHYPIVHPIVRYLPAVQNQMKSVAVPLPSPSISMRSARNASRCMSKMCLSPSPCSAFEQTPLDYWIENGVLRIDFPADKRLHRSAHAQGDLRLRQTVLKHFIRPH